LKLKPPTRRAEVGGTQQKALDIGSNCYIGLLDYAGVNVILLVLTVSCDLLQLLLSVAHMLDCLEHTDISVPDRVPTWPRIEWKRCRTDTASDCCRADG
jgi:hypothetical protein